MIREEVHALISAMNAAGVDINMQAKVMWHIGEEEEILYPGHYVLIDEEGIHPYEDVWKQVPNWRKNEILTIAYDYKSKQLYK